MCCLVGQIDSSLQSDQIITFSMAKQLIKYVCNVIKIRTSVTTKYNSGAGTSMIRFSRNVVVIIDLEQLSTRDAIIKTMH